MTGNTKKVSVLLSTIESKRFCPANVNGVSGGSEREGWAVHAVDVVVGTLEMVLTVDRSCPISNYAQVNLWQRP